MRGMKIDVLDHGLVRLVDFMGDDKSVVRSARVSYDAEWRTGEDAGKDEKLIHYLMRNKHSSPFESVTFTFEVKAPIFVLRQWMRHRTWCLAGDVELVFNRPVDGAPYRIRLDRLAKSWNPPAAKRRRADQSALSLEEHNRQRIQSMSLRCLGEEGEIDSTQIIDVWESGEKMVYELITSSGKSIKASGDHRFYSSGEWVELRNLKGKKVTILGRAGSRRGSAAPSYTPEELHSEKWVEFSDGYRVSNLGRVQTQWGQGARSKQTLWLDKKISINKAGRAVVSVKNKALQVSTLVAEAFLEKPEAAEVVRHINDNSQDNRMTNLAWGTHKDNHKDSYVNGGRVFKAWVDEEVVEIKEVGVQKVYDVSVSHPTHSFVANDFLVHNCYNEVSARYSELPEEYYVPELAQITTQSSDNKQMRTNEAHPRAVDFRWSINMANDDAFQVYKELITQGCPRELARTVLPVGTYSHMFATVDLHNLFHFLRLRLHEHSQYEIRVYAEALLKLIEPIVPVSVAAFKEYA